MCCYINGRRRRGVRPATSRRDRSRRWVQQQAGGQDLPSWRLAPFWQTATCRQGQPLATVGRAATSENGPSNGRKEGGTAESEAQEPVNVQAAAASAVSDETSLCVSIRLPPMSAPASQWALVGGHHLRRTKVRRLDAKERDAAKRKNLPGGIGDPPSSFPFFPAPVVVHGLAKKHFSKRRHGR